MTQLPAELANLPPPALVEELSYEAQLDLFRARLRAAFEAAGIDYDVSVLETDPAQILLQVSAYQDTLLRQRINEAIQSWFLAYARGGDLDALAQWYDVTRLPGEDDDRLRRRIILSIQGRSPGGTEERYESIALGADIRVAAVKAYRIGRDPTIHVAVFSTDNSGIASPALLAKVDTTLQARGVRMVNDTIIVASAAQRAVSITANYWLLPGAPESTADLMAAHLRQMWPKAMMLGRDVTESWVKAQLHIDGVQRVELVDWVDEEMPFNQAAALGAVTLNKMGRAY